MSGALVTPFPEAGELMALAYYDLYRAETAKNADDVADLGPLDQLPRPWDITTITDPALRAEVWAWLDAVVGWINRSTCGRPAISFRRAGRPIRTWSTNSASSSISVAAPAWRSRPTASWTGTATVCRHSSTG